MAYRERGLHGQMAYRERKKFEAAAHCKPQPNISWGTICDRMKINSQVDSLNFPNVNISNQIPLQIAKKIIKLQLFQCMYIYFNNI